MLFTFDESIAHEHHPIAVLEFERRVCCAGRRRRYHANSGENPNHPAVAASVSKWTPTANPLAHAHSYDGSLGLKWADHSRAKHWGSSKLPAGRIQGKSGVPERRPCT